MIPKLLAIVSMLSLLADNCFKRVESIPLLQLKKDNPYDRYINQPHTFMTKTYQIIDRWLQDNMDSDHLDPNLQAIFHMKTQEEEYDFKSSTEKGSYFNFMSQSPKPFLLSDILASTGIDNSTELVIDALKLLYKLEPLLRARSKEDVCTIENSRNLAINNYLAVDPVGRRIRSKEGLVQIKFMPRLDNVIYKAALKKAEVCLPYYPILVAREFYLSNGYFHMIADFWNAVIKNRMHRDHFAIGKEVDEVFAWNPHIAYNYVLDIDNLMEIDEVPMIEAFYMKFGWRREDGAISTAMTSARRFFATKHRQYINSMRPIFEQYDFDKHLEPYIPRKRNQPTEFEYQAYMLKSYLHLSQRFLVEAELFYKLIDEVLAREEAEAARQAALEARGGTNKQAVEEVGDQTVDRGGSGNSESGHASGHQPSADGSSNQPVEGEEQTVQQPVVGPESDNQVAESAPGYQSARGESSYQSAGEGPTYHTPAVGSLSLNEDSLHGGSATKAEVKAKPVAGEHTVVP